mmetsp:Transcript_29652/g.96935  ORF Transcript_29652/g.96935 Transcript_29652/m.96935 type:complete len:317 (-) Transcript_29652:303-1253(-)
MCMCERLSAPSSHVAVVAWRLRRRVARASSCLAESVPTIVWAIDSGASSSQTDLAQRQAAPPPADAAVLSQLFALPPVPPVHRSRRRRRRLTSRPWRAHIGVRAELHAASRVPLSPLFRCQLRARLHQRRDALRCARRRQPSQLGPQRANQGMAEPRHLHQRRLRKFRVHEATRSTRNEPVACAVDQPHRLAHLLELKPPVGALHDHFVRCAANRLPQRLHKAEHAGAWARPKQSQQGTAEDPGQCREEGLGQAHETQEHSVDAVANSGGNEAPRWVCSDKHDMIDLGGHFHRTCERIRAATAPADDRGGMHPKLI